MAKLVTNPQRLQQVLSYLPANEAFGAAKVSQAFQKSQACLDARLYLSQIRPDAWLHRNELDQEFNRQLLRDWHLCLRGSALQVAYVDYHQHLIYVEPSCSLTASPQRQDPVPVDVDSQDYRCSIEPFDLDCLWWDCLQGELFDWPRVEQSDAQFGSAPAAGYQPQAREVPVESFELEAVPGYHGSLAAPKLPDDVLAILSLNAAWFNCSFWARELQGIFLPRVESNNSEDFEKRFGRFLRASKSCDKVLFSTLEVDHEEGRKHLQAGDRVRVLRGGNTFIWSSCRCGDWAVPQGAVSPQLDAEYLERASQQDLRFNTFSGGCHLGLRRNQWYDAEVVHVNADNTLDVKFTNPEEWSSGASGFTDGRGNDRNEAPIEADVAIERAKVLPKNRWYSAFQAVWKECRCFTTVSMSFGDAGRSVHGSNNTSEEAEMKEVDSKAEIRFLKLADVFADTAEAHRFRFTTLFEEKDMLAGEDRQSIEELHSTVPDGRYPRGAHMALGKRLFLQLLRTSFWEKWIAQGGESPSKIINLFNNDKFVRLVIR
ncbi:unnamed protein product [Effrenium voratum]|uniref:Uncharacterized protein n=1 Tax=Effrenium voratum TaxID=2562239 RepID=A0AA36IUC4_9DINO|nr:unnamed protein product [Effrenium voratum]